MPKFCRESMDMNMGPQDLGGMSCQPRPGKTAQKPLKSCLKNRSKITARNERFLSGFLSKIWAVWAVFPKKPPKPTKPLKPLKSCLKNRSKITARNERFLSGFLSKIWAVWAVFPKKPPKPTKPLKPLKSCWKTAQTAQILSGFWAGSRPGYFLLNLGYIQR